MASAARRSRLILAAEVIAVVLATVVLAAACEGSPSHPAVTSAPVSSAKATPTRTASAAPVRAVSLGVAGT